MPSDEDERRVLKDRVTAIVVTGWRCPKRLPLGARSTVLAVADTVQTVIVQSVPAVIRVRESRNVAAES